MCMKGSPLPMPLPKADNALGVVPPAFKTLDDLFAYEGRPKQTSIPVQLTGEQLIEK